MIETELFRVTLQICDPPEPREICDRLELPSEAGTPRAALIDYLALVLKPHRGVFAQVWREPCLRIHFQDRPRSGWKPAPTQRIRPLDIRLCNHGHLSLAQAARCARARLASASKRLEAFPE